MTSNSPFTASIHPASESGPPAVVADLASSSTAESREPNSTNLDVVPSTQSVVEAVDNNGNKLIEIDADVSDRTVATSSSVESPMVDGSHGDWYQLKSCNVTLTPLKQLLKSSSSSTPLEDSMSLTPTKLLQGSSPKPLMLSKSQVTPSESPRSKVVKSRSPTPQKPSTSSKASTPSKSSTPLKSQSSSPRQRSLLEMFTRGAAPSSSSTSVDSTSSTEHPGVEFVHQKLEGSSEHGHQSGVEILVEDSQMGPGSPVRVVDTQESMFVDDTPPHPGSGDPDVTAIAGMAADAADLGTAVDHGLLWTAARDDFANACADIADTCASIASTFDAIADTPNTIADVRDTVAKARGGIASACDTIAKARDTVANLCSTSADTPDTIADIRDTIVEAFATMDGTIDGTCDNIVNICHNIADTHDDIAVPCDNIADTRDSIADPCDNAADTRGSVADTRNSIADSCDSASLSEVEVSQQTIIEVNPAEDVTSASQVQVAGTANQSDVSSVSSDTVGEVSADTVGKVSASHSQAAGVSNETVSDSSLSVSTNTITSMSYDPTDRTQHDVIDPTQHDALDRTHLSSSDKAQHGVVDYSQSSTLDLSQRSVDHTQESVIDHTQVNVVDHTQETVVDHTQAKPVDHTQCDVLVDTASGENAMATDADDYISLSDSSDDDVPLVYHKTSKDDDYIAKRSASETSSVRPRRSLHGKPLAKSRARKDAIHTTLEGRVTRPLVKTRQTPLNLRTRSVRRVADKLVTVGAKHAEKLPSRVGTGRPRGRPKRSELSKPEVPQIPPRQLRRRSAKRPSRYTWMHVTGAELDTGTTQHKDLVEAGCQGSVSGAASEKVGDIAVSLTAKCDAVDEGTELQPDFEKGTAGEVLAKMIAVDEASSGVDKSPQDDDGEEVDLNAGVEPTAGVEMLPPQCCGKPESGINEAISGDKVVKPSAERSIQSSGALATSVAGTEDIVADTRIEKINLPSEVVADVTPVVPISNSADGDGTTDLGVLSSTTGDVNSMEVSETRTEVGKSTPTPESTREYQWKVPTSSVTRGPTTTPADAPPETPISIPRRRFTSRGSLMLERAKQLRRSAAASPPGKSAGKSSGNHEEEISERSPGSAARHSSSGLSRLRVFSPAASPSAGILRKRQLSTDSAGSSSGQSPLSPSTSSRVSYRHYSTAV